MSAPASAQPTTPSGSPIGVAEYLRVSGVLVAYCIGLAVVTRGTPKADPSPERLVAPIIALVGVTALVWLLMVVVRNATILRGITNADYYSAYQPSRHPPEWVERPARAFNNLLQVPVLFYVVCLLMMITGRVDEPQVTFAWIYVAIRVLHAVIYIGWNYVPYRFGAWLASCIALGVIWFRFAF